MRYPLLARDLNTDKILEAARKEKIFLDDGWRKTAVIPPDTDQDKTGYLVGDCPTAEKIAKEIINLPTHLNVSKGEARRIVNFLNKIEKM